MKSTRPLPIGAALLFLVLAFFLRRDERPETAETRPLDSSSTPKEDESLTGLGSVPTDFRAWLEAYRAAPGSPLMPSGLAVAKERRENMKRLIKNDPAEALRQAVSRDERKGLPREIVDLLEVPISAAGEFELVVTCYTAGLRKPKGAPDMERFVTTDTTRYRAFTFGRRAEMLT